MEFYRVYLNNVEHETFLAKDKEDAEKTVVSKYSYYEAENGDGSVEYELVNADEEVSRLAEIYGTKSFHESYNNKDLIEDLAEELDVSTGEVRTYFEENLLPLDEAWERDNKGKEKIEDASFGRKAWELNEIISSMNDEEAYYGGWLYIWPDGESYEDCQRDFAKEEDYKELEEEFIKVYKAYHEEGLWTDDEYVVELAHKWDEKLGLSPIEDMYKKFQEKHGKTKDEDSVVGKYIQTPDGKHEYLIRFDEGVNKYILQYFKTGYRKLAQFERQFDSLELAKKFIDKIIKGEKITKSTKEDIYDITTSDGINLSALLITTTDEFGSYYDVEISNAGDEESTSIYEEEFDTLEEAENYIHTFEKTPWVDSKSTKDEELGEQQSDEEEKEDLHVYTFESPIEVRVVTEGSWDLDNASGYVKEINAAIKDDEDIIKDLPKWFRKGKYIVEMSFKAEERNYSAVLISTVITDKVLNDEEIEDVEDYLTGQFSDGWGEGFEQHAISDWTEDQEYEEWDEETEEPYTETYPVKVEAFASFWSSKDWYIKLIQR